MNLPLITLPLAPALGLGLLGGVAVGLVHFLGLRRTVGLLSVGRIGPALAWQLVRVLTSALCLAALFALGLHTLIAGLVGFLLARQVLLRERRPPAPTTGEPDA